MPNIKDEKHFLAVINEIVFTQYNYNDSPLQAD